MTRQWGRAPKGERIAEAGVPSGRSWPMGWEATPQGRWQVLTTLGTMSLRGSEAAMAIEEATDGDIFLAYVEQVLCATL